MRAVEPVTECGGPAAVSRLLLETQFAPSFSSGTRSRLRSAGAHRIVDAELISTELQHHHVRPGLRDIGAQPASIEPRSVFRAEVDHPEARTPAYHPRMATGSVLVAQAQVRVVVSAEDIATLFFEINSSPGPARGSHSAAGRWPSRTESGCPAPSPARCPGWRNAVSGAVDGVRKRTSSRARPIWMRSPSASGLGAPGTRRPALR